jgi:hypothetical protein
VSQRVERAERAGLVRRVPVPDDARKVAVELTVEGYRAAARLVRVVMAADRTLLETLDEAQRAVLRDVLRSWGTALDRTTALGARLGGTEQRSGRGPSGDRLGAAGQVDAAGPQVVVGATRSAASLGR